MAEKVSKCLKADKYYEENYPLFICHAATIKAVSGIGHISFKAACSEECGITTGQGRRLIRAAKIYDILKGVATIIPTVEWQVRPLTMLEPAQIVEAWNMAVELAHGKQPTSDLVTYAAWHVRLKSSTLNPAQIGTKSQATLTSVPQNPEEKTSTLRRLSGMLFGKAVKK